MSVDLPFRLTDKGIETREKLSKAISDLGYEDEASAVTPGLYYLYKKTWHHLNAWDYALLLRPDGTVSIRRRSGSEYVMITFARKIAEATGIKVVIE